MSRTKGICVWLLRPNLQEVITVEASMFCCYSYSKACDIPPWVTTKGRRCLCSLLLFSGSSSIVFSLCPSIFKLMLTIYFVSFIFCYLFLCCAVKFAYDFIYHVLFYIWSEYFMLKGMILFDVDIDNIKFLYVID